MEKEAKKIQESQILGGRMEFFNPQPSKYITVYLC